MARGDLGHQVAQDLVAKGITDVIVGPRNQRVQMGAFFTDLFGRPPEEVDGVQQTWRNADRAGVPPGP